MPGRTVLPTALYGLAMQILGYFSTGKHWAILGKFKGTIWAGNLKKIWQHWFWTSGLIFRVVDTSEVILRWIRCVQDEVLFRRRVEQ